MSNKPTLVLSIALSFFALISCHEEASDKPVSTAKISRLNKFHNQLLLIGCIAYAQNTQTKLNYEKTDDFFAIDSKFKEAPTDDPGQADSVLNAFIAKNPNVDFSSNEAHRRINGFVDSYNIVSDIIFGKIDSDDKTEEMKALEEKIKKVPEVFRIYNLYMKGRPDLSSLSSSEGCALNIHLACYFNTLDINKRNELLKQLL